MTDVHDLFKTLRKSAKENCTCGNKDFVAPMFHDSNCPYAAISEQYFMPKGESSHADETSI